MCREWDVVTVLVAFCRNECQKIVNKGAVLRRVWQLQWVPMCCDRSHNFFVLSTHCANEWRGGMRKIKVEQVRIEFRRCGHQGVDQHRFTAARWRNDASVTHIVNVEVEIVWRIIFAQ